MPTYTYKCTNCGHIFEASQRMTDDPLDECPVCKGNIRRVINSVGVVFKGQGFYVTDNRRSATLPSTSGTSGSESTAADAGTKPAKPEPTAPAKPTSSESAPAREA